jgi:predicted GIY-YIG superfamily endonuclease
MNSYETECHTYVLKNPKGWVYIGTTINSLWTRLKQHNRGDVGAAYTREALKPWTLVHHELCASMRDAAALEKTWLDTLRKTGTLPFLDFTPSDWGPKRHPGHGGDGNPSSKAAKAERDADRAATQAAHRRTVSATAARYENSDPDATPWTRIAPSDALPGAWTLHTFDPVSETEFYVGTFPVKADAIATAKTWQETWHNEKPSFALVADDN